MKKLFYLLYLLPLAFFASCSNDDDLANVDLTLTLSGVTQIEENGAFYTVAGNDITVDGVSVKSLTGKDATIVNVRYFFQGVPLPFLTNPDDPMLGTFSTEGIEAGNYTLSLTAQVLQVDKTITNVAANYRVVIVENAEDLPDNAPEIGTYHVTTTIAPEK